MSGKPLCFVFLSLIIILCIFQKRSSTWSKSVLTYKTESANRLPIIDIAMRDVGGANQEFWFEIGPVCFY